MDRFESATHGSKSATAEHIYIPIWIDLKAGRARRAAAAEVDLHSNMDRFERDNIAKIVCDALKFTFQYG